MPLSTNDEVVITSNGLLDTLKAAAGPQPGFRPAHAKGRLMTGNFKPSSKGSELTSAPHFQQTSTPITVRFSSSTGLPEIPDTDSNANPRGIAIRFHLPEVKGRRSHTDIVAHSTKYFPTRTGAEFLEFLQAATGSNAAEKLPQFLAKHPETGRFLEEPKPSPASFAQQKYFGVNAFKYTSNGSGTYLRYRIVPVAGEKYLSDAELKTQSPTYLFDEILQRLKKEVIVFRLLAQIAAQDDMTSDASVIWPEDREIVELGEIEIDAALSDEENARSQKRIIFDPIPRVAGIEPSDDPLLDIRANVYLISGKQRREAKQDFIMPDAAPTSTKLAT